jgi:hypothetical protein
VFDYREGDTYWCTADCGWITGHSYIAYGPTLNAATQVPALSLTRNLTIAITPPSLSFLSLSFSPLFLRQHSPADSQQRGR